MSVENILRYLNDKRRTPDSTDTLDSGGVHSSSIDCQGQSTRLDPADYINRGSVVFVGFHPDDLDFHAAGLAATLAKAGASVIFVVVTSGEGNGNPRQREKEQKESARSLGVERVVFLRRNDLGLAEDFRKGRLQREMCLMIRMLRPYAIVTFCPANLTSETWGFEHPDHRYGSLAVSEAVYPESHQQEKLPWWKFWREPLPGHKVKELIWFGDDLAVPYAANCVLPVENVWTARCNALNEHKSQWSDQQIVLKVTERALRTARRWGHDGVAEEYHRIVIN
mgnify:CR=1 FL=1